MATDQHQAMLAVLAKAFDRAATTQPTADAAAIHIEAALRKAGYGIAVRIPHEPKPVRAGTRIVSR